MLEQAELRFDVKAGPTGSLFGSVTPTDIADELWEKHKVRVDRRKIELEQPIKQVGRYVVRVAIFEDVRVEVRTVVVPEGGELPPAGRGLRAEEAAVEEPSEGRRGAGGRIWRPRRPRPPRPRGDAEGVAPRGKSNA